MIIIDDILISSDVAEKHFVCNLEKCKGACCYEGDFGAPLEKPELEQIGALLEKIRPYLSEESILKIKEEGFFTFNEKSKVYETALMNDASCVFMGRDQLGITFCGIEKAYHENKIAFKKPISCHLYPIRITKNEAQGFEALNYDQWDICQSACTYGAKKNVRIYEFAKEALIRKYGQEFYDALAAAVKEYSQD
ncbi:MAG: DUF3109 family protein [Bacteroidia bacterium]|nr:DUF3109 family protein [Bacteroidia bacterium]